ncbi:T9SS type A sorting domain-containing protein [Ilyomonas limi]|uniref:T9SS type A sorting domain-containing protein n=1 Tax=Ilyomonas limi TaxID=2575867 RepID=A0A4U3L044_9BACT|nr:choice-of-anchor tandem repeat GloVer-containing protein [Ilyomonas limi]TKK67474.1 T9SS type A sorting domain-containing protein [Ilyomonas limi]
MKKILLALSCIACFFTLHAQVLYGTASDGGTNGKGTINTFNTNAGILNAIFTFDSPDGAHPQFSGLIKANDGKLYGMTRYGGSNNYGVLFSYEPTSSKYTLLKDFDVSSGTYPYGSLMQAKDGKLYGMTTYGGNNNAGVIFSFDPVSAVYTKLKDLDIANGAWPYGHLIQATDGKLYGLTSYGGNRNTGVIFSFNPSSLVYTKLKDLDGGNGGSPYGSLMQAADGKLYGMTAYGGSKGEGVIFSYDLTTATYSRQIDFDGSNGAYPYGHLIQTADGKLYGMTNAGGYFNDGVIFSFNPSTFTYTKLKDFDIASGGNPYDGLMQAADGKLYGTTSDGGSNNSGVIFSFNPVTAAYVKLKDLDDANGSSPQSNLVQTTDGKLYSMTTNGGSGGSGVIFAFDPSQLSYTKVKDFGSNTVGSNVLAGLIQSAGKLYGMTNTGGNKGAGVIYSFNPATSMYTNLYSFDGANGSNPYGSLMQAKDGKLYGMTYSGGSKGYGVIFLFDTATSLYTKVYDFDYSKGGNPTGSLIQATNGKLYGMTYYGGNNGAGVVFSFDPVTLVYTKLVDFNGTNGAYPYGSLMQATDNKLYGLTYSGGSKGFGVIFSFDPATSIYTKQRDFAGTNGSNPTGNLLQAADGKLYGMTSFGGSSDKGVIFSFIPTTLTFARRKDFDGISGGNPHGSLMQAADGKLYGVTNAGGNNNAGVIFSFAPAKSTYTKLQDFDGTNGSAPQYVTLTEATCAGTTFYRDADSDGYGDINNSTVACVQPAGYVADSTDCNDSDANANKAITWYIDADADGYSGDSTMQCSRPANGFLLAELTGGTGDCDDSNTGIHPDATEIPGDSIDQDCDGFDLKTWYADADGDSYGNANTVTTANEQPTGYVANSTDCNDGDGTIYPGAPELCDGKDNNCDGTVDEGCAVPKLRINDVSLTEGNSGMQKMTFSVTLSVTSAQTVTVSYRTRNGTATAPDDYEAQSGMLTFEPGVKKQTISIIINGDAIVEGDETFNVRLGNPVNATISRALGTGTILDDETSSTSPVGRNNGGSTYVVSISPNPANNVLNVKLDSFRGKVILQLTNLQGKVLKEAKLQTMGNEWHAQQRFNVSDMASGTYLIVVLDEEGNKQTKKVVIAHR